MRISLCILFSLTTFSLFYGQSADDWTWHTPSEFDKSANGLSFDPDGNLWMGSGTKVFRFDGVNWTSYELLDLGLKEEDAMPRYIDASLGSRIWISTDTRVIEFDAVNNIHIIHNPFYISPNYQAYSLKVEAPGKVWWSSGNRLWYYNGATWNKWIIDPNPINIESSARQIEIDQQGNKWIATPSSICIEGGCFTPAGLIRLNDTDTTFFDGEHYGYPEAGITHVDLDSQENPWLVISDFGDDNYYMIYANGVWSAPVDIPFKGSISDMQLGKNDELYLVMNNFVTSEHSIVIGKDDTWDVIYLDNSVIDIPRSFLLSPEDDIYIAGESPGPWIDRHGVMGYLPNLPYRARGIVYSDLNFNSTLDAGDQVLKDQFVQTVNQDRITLTNNNGAFSMLFLSPGNYTIEGILPAYHQYSDPVNGQHTVSLTPVDPIVEGNHFGYQPDTSKIDLSVTITGFDSPNPGFSTCVMVTVKNQAPKVTSGDVTVVFDPLLTFDYADEPPGSIVGNQLTFHIDPLTWLVTKTIKICFTLPPDAGLLRDTLSNISNVVPFDGTDAEIKNNADTLYQIIRGSYDPNFIEVSPAGAGVTGDIPLSTQRLEYTIHFQNTGTDTARNILISNAIDPDLELRTFQVQSTSHPYELGFIEEGRILRWAFDDIQLPDSFVNQQGSNGFIRYSIDLAEKNIGTRFTNQADIYFDYNSPIATNEAINTLKDFSSAVFDKVYTEACEDEIIISEGGIVLSFPDEKVIRMRVFDLLGRELLHHNIVSYETSIEPGLRYPGFYLIAIEFEDCYMVKKFFIR